MDYTVNLTRLDGVIVPVDLSEMINVTELSYGTIITPKHSYDPSFTVQESIHEIAMKAKSDD